MKKVFHLFGFVVLFMILCITNVNASECTTKEFRELKTLAKKVQIVYEFDDSGIEEKSAGFLLTAYNLNNRLELRFSDGTYFLSNKNEKIGYFRNGEYIEFEIYASENTNCSEYRLRKESFKLPIFNFYSIRQECVNKEKMNVCKKWSDTSYIDENKFLELVNSDNNSEKSDGFFAKIISFVIQYGIYLIGGIVIVVIITILIIVIRKKRKNKLDSIRSLV